MRRVLPRLILFKVGCPSPKPVPPACDDLMEDEVNIRHERPDHPQVQALLRRLDDYLGSLYPPEANHILGLEALLAPEVTFLAAWHQDIIVGCGAVRTMPGEPQTEDEPYGEVKRMYVEPSFRGLRMGSRLLSSLESHMHANGLRWSLLETGKDQHEAVRLYARSGYLPRGPFGGYDDNGLSVFMAKPLP